MNLLPREVPTCPTCEVAGGHTLNCPKAEWAHLEYGSGELREFARKLWAEQRRQIGYGSPRAG